MGSPLECVEPPSTRRARPEEARAAAAARLSGHFQPAAMRRSHVERPLVRVRLVPKASPQDLQLWPRLLPEPLASHWATNGTAPPPECAAPPGASYASPGRQGWHSQGERSVTLRTRRRVTIAIVCVPRSPITPPSCRTARAPHSTSCTCHVHVHRVCTAHA